jgi:hypothetical protein
LLSRKRASRSTSTATKSTSTTARSSVNHPVSPRRSHAHADKDVARTDRDNAYFEGDENPHLVLLRDILLTHTELDAELGTPACMLVCR